MKRLGPIDAFFDIYFDRLILNQGVADCYELVSLVKDRLNAS